MLLHRCPYCEKVYKCKGSHCSNPFLRLCRVCYDFYVEVYGVEGTQERQRDMAHSHHMELQRQATADYSVTFEYRQEGSI